MTNRKTDNTHMDLICQNIYKMNTGHTLLSKIKNHMKMAVILRKITLIQAVKKKKIGSHKYG